jgi:hypothetical protein
MGNDRGAGADLADALTGWSHLAGAPVPFTELAAQVFYSGRPGQRPGHLAGLDWGNADASDDVAISQIFQFRDVGWDGVGDTPFDDLTASSVNGDFSSLGMPAIATLLPNSLAVACCCATDNVTFAAPTGETGGDWVDSGHATISTTSNDDASMRVFIAEMPEPGTLSGGASAITPTTPFTSKSVAMGFALRGKLAA